MPNFRDKPTAALIIFFLFFVLIQPVFGQAGAIDVRAYDADVSKFPEVCLRVAPVTGEGVTVSNLTSDAFRVLENGSERPVSSVESVYAGTVIAFVLDASGSFAEPTTIRSEGGRRIDEAVDAIDDLVRSDKWLENDQRLDRFLLVAPKGETEYSVIQDWTEHPVAIHNGAYQLSLDSTETALYGQLVAALVKMKEAPDWEKRAKFLVILSDGIDRRSFQNGDDIIRRANDLGVTILSIKIGPEGEGEADNLQRLASETGGAFATYTGVDSVANLYERVRTQTGQYHLCYQSGINQQGRHATEVVVQVDGQEYRSAPVGIAVTPRAPSVVVKEPLDGAVINRVAGSWDQDPTTIEPLAQPVNVEVSWPDGFPRGVENVSYEIDGRVAAMLPPDQGFSWDLRQALAGAHEHTLRVIVRDALGMEGASDPVRVTVSTDIPDAPPPTPTPIPPLTERLKTQIVENPLLPVVLIVALIAVALAIYAILKKPQFVQDMTTTIVGAVRDATEVFRPRRGGATRTANAYLVPLQNPGGSLDPIAIRAQTVYIGRDPSRSQITFSEKSVSRLHARIVEESDGVFMLYDEGSSSGTFYNDERLEHQPRRLSKGDEIDFGRVRVRFEVSSEGDTTEPFHTTYS